MQNSYFYRWLNSRTPLRYNEFSEYDDKNGFLSCIPEDFIKATSGIFSILSATEGYAKANSGTTIYSSADAFDKDTAWEYWINRIGVEQEAFTLNENRRIASINYPTAFTSVMTRSIQYYSSNKQRRQVYFDYRGYVLSTQASSAYQYLPICVIG